MKLHEIKHLRRHHLTTTVTVEPAGGIYGEIDVEVKYEVEPASSTLHVPGDPTTREYHAAQIDIGSITLDQDVSEYDEDGEKTGKVWPKGTNARNLPGWDESDDKFVFNKVSDEEDNRDDDFDEPDDYYDDDPYFERD